MLGWPITEDNIRKLRHKLCEVMLANRNIFDSIVHHNRGVRGRIRDLLYVLFTLHTHNYFHIFIIEREKELLIGVKMILCMHLQCGNNET